MVFDLPVKPAADPSRTPALIGKEVDLIMRITVASIAVGYRLMEAKSLEGHGGWLPWLAARGINERTARRTIELASHHQYLTQSQPEKLPDFMSRSLRQALAIVHEERARTKGKPRPKGKRNGGPAASEDAPEVEILPPDPVHVLHHLVQQWPAGAIRQHQLTTEQADLLEEDLPVLLPALIELAERHDVSTGVEREAAPAQVEQAVAAPAPAPSDGGPLTDYDPGMIVPNDPRSLVGDWLRNSGAQVAVKWLKSQMSLEPLLQVGLRLLIEEGKRPTPVLRHLCVKLAAQGAPEPKAAPEAGEEAAPEPEPASEAAPEPTISAPELKRLCADAGVTMREVAQALKYGTGKLLAETLDRGTLPPQATRQLALIVAVLRAEKANPSAPGDQPSIGVRVRRAAAEVFRQEPAPEAAPEPAAAPGGSQADREAFARRVRAAMGDESQKTFAARCGVSVPTLRKVLAGKPVRADIRAQVETCLAGGR
jgi:hypothetical protein